MRLFSHSSCKNINTEEDFEQYDLLMRGKLDKMNSSLGFYKNFSLIKNVLDKKIKTTEKRYYGRQN